MGDQAIKHYKLLQRAFGNLNDVKRIVKDTEKLVSLSAVLNRDIHSYIDIHGFASIKEKYERRQLNG